MTDDLTVTKKYTKHLLVDPIIPETQDQNYVCVSFVNPKDLIEQKKLFSINRFMCEDINNELSMVGRQLGMHVSRTLKNSFDKEYERVAKMEDKETAELHKELLDNIFGRINITEEELEQRCIRNYTHDHEDLVARFQNYMVEHGAEIDREFEKMNNNRTSTLGFKIRAVTSTLEECTKLSEYFRDKVENYVETFVAPLRHWLPFNPDPDRIDSKYQLGELNTLMNTKQIEKKYQDQVFNDRITNVTDANGMRIDYTKSTENKLHNMLDKKRKKHEIEKYGLDTDTMLSEDATSSTSKKNKRRRRRGKKQPNTTLVTDNEINEKFTK